MNEMSDQIAELATALAKAQAAITPAVKDKVNPGFRSRYADLASVWEACRAALTSNGLSVVQLPLDRHDGCASLRTVLLHTSGQYLATTVSARLVKDDAQGLGSALTYLRRYSLAAMVGVVADEDDDGNAASKAPAQQARQERQEPQEPPRLPSRSNGSAPATKAPPVVATSASPARVALVQELRDAYKAAHNAGADVSPPDAATVARWNDVELHKATSFMQAKAAEASLFADAT